MAIAEKPRISKLDVKEGIDSKKEEATLAVVEPKMRAEKRPHAGRGRPQRRGDVFNGIVTGSANGCASTLKKLINKPRGDELKPPLSQQSTAGGRAALVKEPKPRNSLMESSVHRISVAGKCPSSTALIVADSTIPLVKLWAEVDMTNTLLHDGSALFEEENGGWKAMALSPADAAEN